MSKTLLKMRIEELNTRLADIIKEKNYDLIDCTVVDLSQRLDKLIVEYIQKYA